jgi:hypothetical protein
VTDDYELFFEQLKSVEGTYMHTYQSDFLLHSIVIQIKKTVVLVAQYQSQWCCGLILRLMILNYIFVWRT